MTIRSHCCHLVSLLSVGFLDVGQLHYTNDFSELSHLCKGTCTCKLSNLFTVYNTRKHPMIVCTKLPTILHIPLH